VKWLYDQKSHDTVASTKDGIFSHIFHLTHPALMQPEEHVAQAADCHFE
jgi:hypothetical protein